MSYPTTRTICRSDGHVYTMAVAWCGCSNDWMIRVIDPNRTPSESDSCMLAHGFDSEAEAAAYLRDYDPENPPKWEIVETPGTDFPRSNPFEAADLADLKAAIAVEEAVVKLLAATAPLENVDVDYVVEQLVASLIKRNPEALDWLCEGSMTLANVFADWRTGGRADDK